MIRKCIPGDALRVVCARARDAVVASKRIWLCSIGCARRTLRGATGTARSRRSRGPRWGMMRRPATRPRGLFLGGSFSTPSRQSAVITHLE